MIFVVAIFGALLGYFRYFRIGNIVSTFEGFSTTGRYSKFVGILYIALFLLLLIFLFYVSLLLNFDDFNPFQSFELSIPNLSYFLIGYVFGEVCRLLSGAPLGGQDGDDSFLDLLQSLSPKYYFEGSFEETLGFEACVAIEVSAWLYGIRSDVKRSLILAVSKEFHIPRYHRHEVLDFFDNQTGANWKAKRALNAYVQKLGTGTIACESFLEKIAKLGSRSGFEVSDVKSGLFSIGEILGLSEQNIIEAIERAEKISTDHDWRDFSADHFWGQRQSQNRQQYTHQNHQRADSYSSPRSVDCRETHLGTLDLRAGATEKEIRSAYRKLAMKNHPDRVQAEGGTDKDVDAATQKMSELNTAYDWLCKNPA